MDALETGVCMEYALHRLMHRILSCTRTNQSASIAHILRPEFLSLQLSWSLYRPCRRRKFYLWGNPALERHPWDPSYLRTTWPVTPCDYLQHVRQTTHSYEWLKTYQIASQLLPTAICYSQWTLNTLMWDFWAIWRWICGIVVDSTVFMRAISTRRGILYLGMLRF